MMHALKNTTWALLSVAFFSFENAVAFVVVKCGQALVADFSEKKFSFSCPRY